MIFFLFIISFYANASSNIEKKDIDNVLHKHVKNLTGKAKNYQQFIDIHWESQYDLLKRLHPESHTLTPEMIIELCNIRLIVDYYTFDGLAHAYNIMRLCFQCALNAQKTEEIIDDEYAKWILIHNEFTKNSLKKSELIKLIEEILPGMGNFITNDYIPFIDSPLRKYHNLTAEQLKYLRINHLQPLGQLCHIDLTLWNCDQLYIIANQLNAYCVNLALLSYDQLHTSQVQEKTLERQQQWNKCFKEKVNNAHPLGQSSHEAKIMYSFGIAKAVYSMPFAKFSIAALINFANINHSHIGLTIISSQLYRCAITVMLLSSNCKKNKYILGFGLQTEINKHLAIFTMYNFTSQQLFIGVITMF